jgi:hypothetical protein
VLPSQAAQPQIGDATVAAAAERGARDGFYFLAPLVAETSYTGEFDGALLHVSDGGDMQTGRDQLHGSADRNL